MIGCWLRPLANQIWLVTVVINRTGKGGGLCQMWKYSSNQSLRKFHKQIYPPLIFKLILKALHHPKINPLHTETDLLMIEFCLKYQRLQ